MVSYHSEWTMISQIYTNLRMSSITTFVIFPPLDPPTSLVKTGLVLVIRLQIIAAAHRASEYHMGGGGPPSVSLYHITPPNHS